MDRLVFTCRTTVLVIIALLGWTVSASAEHRDAHDGGAVDGDEAHVEAELILDVDSIGSDQIFRAGVRLTIDPDWHVYWKNSGDAGFPTEVDFDSEAIRFGPLQYPAPETFLESGGLATTFGYTNEVLLITNALTHADARGSVTITADLRFLVCKVLCIPGQIELETALATGPDISRQASSEADLFDRYSDRMPENAAALGLRVDSSFSVAKILSGDSFEFEISVSACSDSSDGCPRTVEFQSSPGEFAFDIPGSIELEVQDVRGSPSSRDGSRLVVRGRVLQGQRPPETIDGVLGLLVDGRPRSVQVSIPLPIERSPTSSSEATEAPTGSSRTTTPLSTMTLPVALGLGLIGGLILNLMPCVLPILALKAFRIVESGGRDSAHLRRQGLSFTLGAMSTMALLAAVVIGLRMTGELVGWGFQFQQPAYIAFMALLLAGFALNLFGVFEINLNFGAFGRSNDGHEATAQSFIDGLLAVLLATPCSAPFLGTAVGFAFSSSAFTVGAIFLSIGLGLALPYLAISFIPGLASKLPKPGPWMVQLRSVLGFALLATVLWLLWISGRSTGPEGLIWLLGLLLSLGFALWTFGQIQRASRPRTALVGALLISVGLVAGLINLPVEAASRIAAAQDGGIRRWDPIAVRETVAGGQIVFVDFTADWCLTCKVNERLVLSSEEVRNEMQRLGVVRYRADWTLRDDAIRAELQRHGRAGVPMYLVFHPNAPDAPQLLPEIITADTLIAALTSARN